MATPDEGPSGGKVSHSPAGSRRPNWRQFERDGAYLLPSGLASDDAQLAAHARMHQLALAYEDSDPLVTRFKGINPKVAAPFLPHPFHSSTALVVLALAVTPADALGIPRQVATIALHLRAAGCVQVGWPAAALHAPAGEAS